MPVNPPPGGSAGPDWEPRPDARTPPQGWPPAPKSWHVWTSRATALTRRGARMRPGLRVGIVISIILLLVLLTGYVLRAMTVHQIETALEEWNATWNTPTDLATRDRLQCAAQKFPIPSSASVHTDVRSELHTDAVSVAPDLSTAYVKATITETYTGPDPVDPVFHGAYDEVMKRGQPYPAAYGFEMVKEGGSWKVCDWGGSAVMQKSRTVLLGWKLLGSP